MMVDQRGPDADAVVGVSVHHERLHGRARRRVRVYEILGALARRIHGGAPWQRYQDIALSCPADVMEFNEGCEIDPAVIQGKVVDCLCEGLPEQVCHFLCAGRL